MKPVLEDIENSKSSNSLNRPSSLSYSYDTLEYINNLNLLSYVKPKIYVEDLAPINPRHLIGYTLGSAAACEMPSLEYRVKTPLENFRVVGEYLEPSKSDLQYRNRFWNVARDTLVINAIAEFGDSSGAFIAGATANLKAETYLREMVETELAINEQEKLNQAIFQQLAE